MKQFQTSWHSIFVVCNLAISWNNLVWPGYIFLKTWVAEIEEIMKDNKSMGVFHTPQKPQVAIYSILVGLFIENIIYDPYL